MTHEFVRKNIKFAFLDGFSGKLIHGIFNIFFSLVSEVPLFEMVSHHKKTQRSMPEPL